MALIVSDVMKRSSTLNYEKLFGGVYKDRRCLVTGHNGFKGSWLCAWLVKMGAKVSGYSLPAPSSPNHFDFIKPDVRSTIGDIRNVVDLQSVIKREKPEIVFHLAAQPLVRESYTDPQNTYTSNVLGTLNVCDACQQEPSVKALVAITTDKVYKNREWDWAYRENDELGGYDPYSSSKACTEIMIDSFRNSYLSKNDKESLLLASARAGNVIGGGDWAKDRLIPDIVRAAAVNKSVQIRYPEAVRPWQHVLECLSGYLLPGQYLLDNQHEYASAFNFGPSQEGELTVREIIEIATTVWPGITYEIPHSQDKPHEAGLLKLDSSKAKTKLNWKSVWDTKTAIEKTIQWYRFYYENGSINTDIDISCYCNDALKGELQWAK